MGGLEKKALPSVIDGSRIELRKLSLELSEAMFRCVEDDRERLGVFLPWVDLTRTLEDEIAYIRSSLEWWESGAQFDYGLFLKGDCRYIGNVGVHTISWQNERCELGYWIAGTHEGQGYVLEGVGLIERALFQVGFNRIEIRCSSANRRSARIPELAGYRLEGCLRQDTLENGRFDDTLIYGKIRADFVP